MAYLGRFRLSYHHVCAWWRVVIVDDVIFDIVIIANIGNFSLSLYDSADELISNDKSDDSKILIYRAYSAGTQSHNKFERLCAILAKIALKLPKIKLILG